MAAKKLPSPSDEQGKIVAAYLKGFNIKIQAVAGAGKSTTLLQCAAADPSKTCLILTYNKKLELDLQERITGLGLQNVKLYTFHGAASRCYQTTINTDVKFDNAVRQPPQTLIPCDTLMCDETQDMCIGYYCFVQYLLSANTEVATKGPPAKRPGHQLLIVGDVRQSINQYKGARPEFLSECEKLFVTGRKWMSLPLSTSYRLTPATAHFVNEQILGAPLIVGGNIKDPNLKPLYLAASYGSMAEEVGKGLRRLIPVYGHENIAVISPSVRTIRHGNPKNPLVQLVKEHLTDVPLYVASSDEEILDDRTLKGKLLISSWNSMKGREKDCVVVLDFHEKYFQYYELQWGSRPDVPNIVYVAATRARKQLIVVADARQTLRTVNPKTIDASVTYVASKRPAPYKFRPAKEKDKRVGVLDLLRHVDTTTERAMLGLIERGGSEYVAAPSEGVTTSFVFHSGSGQASHRYVEDVSCFYGIVIPRIAEYHLKGSTKFGEHATSPNIVDTHAAIVEPWDMTREAYGAFPPDFWENVSSSFTTDCGGRSWADWFTLAVAEHAVYEGRYHVARQIRNYDWISQEFSDQCVACVREALTATKGTFEVYMPSRSLTRGSKTIHLGGIADYVEEGDDKPIWEFKCTDAITDSHLLQLACYMALSGRRVGKLYAIKSGEVATIGLTPKNAETLLTTALQKYDETPRTDIGLDIERFRAGLTPLPTVDEADGCAEGDNPDQGPNCTLEDVFEDLNIDN
jgi:hypothetical protein